MLIKNTRLGALVGALVLACTSNQASLTARGGGLQLGVYDSRAVAVAYANSEAFAERLGQLSSQLDQARAAGDAERVAELEALGPALQQQLHRQGFSIAPVEDLLVEHVDQLPALAEAAGVDVLVSRWALTWQRPDAPLVDVTDRLVALFEPDARTLGWIDDLKGREPEPSSPSPGGMH